MKALLAFFPLFRRRSRSFALALLLSLITLLAGVALLGTSGWFITATALTTLGLGFNLFVPSSLVRGFSFIRILARYGERLVGHNATLQLLSDLRGWLFARLFPRLPLPDRSLRHGDLVSRLTADVDALDNAFLVAIGPWMAAMIMGSGMTVLLAVLVPGAAPIYGLAMATAVILVPLALVWLGRAAGRSSVETNAGMRVAVLDGAVGHADLAAMGALGTACSRFDKASQTAARLRQCLGAYTAGAAAAVQILAAIALVGTLWIGLAGVEAAVIDGPVMAGVLLAVLGSFEVTGTIVRSVGKASAAIAAAERLSAIASLALPVAEPSLPVPVPLACPITIDNVHFGYDTRPPVLSGLSLVVEPGERLAIVGPSGSGKSTILRLLLRLAEPQAGEIRIGGLRLDQFRTADLHAHMALLSQDSPVFIDTVRNNLLMGRPDASDEQLWAALAKAQLDRHIASLPNGLETIVGEAGRTLSVGQARRLCLARAILSPAPVLLLDEPTNALDRETELAFFQTLAIAAEGRSLIMVTHAVIPDGTVDRVLTLKNGQLDQAILL